MPTPVRTGRALATALFTGILLYLLVAVGFAVYLLNAAFVRGIGEYEGAAIGALIAVIGTGLTALASLYTANRQAAVAKEVELLRLDTGKELAELASKLSANLERLKAFLDAEKTAYRELSGAAAIYFYSLRSAALGSWDDQRLDKAEQGMIDASRHTMYVDETMRKHWFDFWQEAQFIYRNACREPDGDKRQELLKKGILEEVQEDDANLNLRDRHLLVEEAARRAIIKEMASPTRSTVI